MPISPRRKEQKRVEADGKLVAIGYGKYFPAFWIQSGETGERAGAHVAFSASSADMVKEWHAAALAAGGTCNGPPGPRPQYDERYYGAFVIDSDGNRLEAVFFDMGIIMNTLTSCTIQ